MKTSLFWVCTALWQRKRIWYWKSNKLEALVICCWQPHLYLGAAWLTRTAGFPWMSLPLGSAGGDTCHEIFPLVLSFSCRLCHRCLLPKGLDSLWWSPITISRYSLLVSHTVAFTEGEDGTEVYAVLLTKISMPLFFLSLLFRRCRQSLKESEK